jgi:membrane-associated phospholipid phosphatase
MAGHVHLPGGAFPSAHCAASTVLLVTAFRHDRKAGRALAPVVVLIYASTVYGRFHYVVDVVAGILLALGALAVAPGMMRACDRWVLGLGVSRGLEPETVRDLGREEAT